MTAAPCLRADVRAQVLRALALNRTPGLHFLGNFLDLSFERVSALDSCLRMPVGPHCTDAAGQVHVAPLALLADIAMATAVRAPLPPETRLGTVSMHLQFTQGPWTGPLEAQAGLDGFVVEGAGQTGHAHGKISGPAGVVCHGSSTFMVLDPPEGKVLAPVPHRRHGDAAVPPLAEAALSDTERAILQYTDAVLDQTGCEGGCIGSGSFASRFFGYDTRHVTTGATGRMINGPHIGNRVGHVQGGISFGFALATAQTALGPEWAISNLTASYISTGEGKMLRSRSRVVHCGRRTAVVRTRVVGAGGRIVLDVLSNHWRRVPQVAKLPAGV